VFWGLGGVAVREVADDESERLGLALMVVH